MPSRTLAARMAGRLRAVALVALLLTHIPPALAITPAAPAVKLAELAPPDPPARPALAAAGVAASMTDAPLADANGNGSADPGETLRYTVVVDNSSGVDQAGATFDDTLDPNTSLVAGSLRISPLAFADSYDASRDTPLAVSAPGILANDTGTPAPTITARSVTTAAGGTATTSADGGFSYAPPPGYTGLDSFNYTASNSVGSDTGVVTLNVRAVPVANDDSYTVARDTSRTVLAPGVLANDTGFPPPAATPLNGATTAGGTVNLAANGGFTYTPPAGFSGADTFVYTAVNSAGSDTATVTLTVGIPPVTQNDAYDTARDTPLSVPAGGLLQNDMLGSPAATLVSFGGGSLAGTAASNPAGATVNFAGGGALAVGADGSLAFTPSAGFAGTFSFGYRIGNVFGTSDGVATISVRQTPAITSTAAATFTAGTPGSFSVTTTGFPTPTLAIGGDALPTGVTFVDNGDGTAALSGTPGSGTGGVYALTFTANSSSGASPTQSFTLTVLEAPAISSAAAASFQVGVAGSFTITTSGFPTSTIDLAGALPAGVTFVDNGDGTGALSGTPSASGSFPLTLTADNGIGSPVPQSFTLVVGQAPAISSAAAVNFIPGVFSTFAVTTVGFPPPSIAIGGAALPTGVTFADNGDGTGTLTGTPGAGTAGAYAITFTAANGVTPNALQNFTLNVACPAIAVTPAAGALADGQYGTAYSQAFTPSGGIGPYTFDLASGSVPGGLTLSAGGTLAGTPTGASGTGSFSFTVRATDAFGCQGSTAYTLQVRPNAQPESYSGGVGNTQFVVGAAPPATPFVFATGSVLANDAGAGALTTTVLTTSTNGSLTLNPDGTFVYTPNVNFAGPSDSFSYTLTDGNGATNTATVTINLSGRVWYVNNSGANGDGRSHSPFNALNNSQAPSSNGDTIFVHTGSGTTPGGITLKPSQVLWGQGTAFALNSLTIAAGAKPVLGGTVVLANDVTVSSLDITTSGASAITGSGVTGVAVQNNVALTSTGAAALSLTTSSGNLSFQSITSSGGTNGISLAGVGGTLTGGVGSLSNSSGALFNVGGGNGTISYAGSVSQSSAARLVDIQSRAGGSVTLSGNLMCDTACTGINVASNTGGTIDFSGASKAITTGASPAVTLANNTGATISFTGGGLAITTSSGAGFSAFDGGTLAVTGANNMIASTTGTALNVANTSIGASGLTFQSISANGAVNGIVLNNTGSSGGLTVTGDGNTSVGGNNSGGTIQNSTSHGVSLTSTLNPSFTNLNIQNTVGSGIFGELVTNFSFKNGTINNSGAALFVTETSNIAFNSNQGGTENNLSGTVTITGNSMTNAFYHGVDIFNYDGTIADANISSNTITSSTSTTTSKGSGIRLVAFGSASTVANVTRATIDGNTITNFPSANGILASGGNRNAGGSAGIFGTNGASSIVITNNTVSGASAVNRIGALGVAATVNGKGTGFFNLDNNSVSNTFGTAISIGSFGFANVTATLTRNTIVANNAVGAQGIGAGTSATFGVTDTPTLNVRIGDGTPAGANNISQTDGNGILVTARDAAGNVNASILRNTVAAPLNGVRPGIRVDAGNAASGDDAVCLDISGNTTGGSGGHEGIGLRKQGTGSTTNDFGIEGMPATSSPGVETFVGNTGQNPGSASGSFGINGVLLLSAISGFSNCSSAPNALASLAGDGAPTLPQAGAVSANIGTIPAGKRVTVIFDVLIANPLPVGVGQLSNQGTVTASGLAAVLTDDPRKPGAADPTITVIGVRKNYLALMMSGAGAGPPLSDLVVSSISTANSGLQVTIRNIGQAPVVEPFWVDAYINPTTAPTRVNQLWNNLGARGATWGVVGSVLPLEVGETLTLTLNDSYYRPELSNPGGPIAAGARLYTQADSFNSSGSIGAVLESHERDGGVYNNILGPVVAP
ncbi:MAG TPA: Ig-like domain-containing protein [Roseiflexaceae bacterium]|nr:Ig-like domain-containing protein [Roseiflexaceae bacterium]